MAEILQGTTPTIRVTVKEKGSDELYDLTDISIAELTVYQYGIGEIVYTTKPTIDRENSRISYIFSEAETLRISSDRRMYWQIRLGKTDLMMPDGMLIVGTLKGSVLVQDLLTERRIS